MKAFSSPVFYGMPDKFALEYDKILTAIERRMDQFKLIDPQIIETTLGEFIGFSTVGTKHPGFSEEREWRVTYNPDPATEHVSDDEYNQQNKIKREFRPVRGIPQRIYKIPFADYPEEGIEGITLPALLKQVIIGPTQYPAVISDALFAAMRRAGFAPDVTSMMPKGFSLCLPVKRLELPAARYRKSCSFRSKPNRSN